MADTLQDIESQVTARMQELEPLVEEYQRLQEVAESMKADRTRSAAGLRPRTAGGRIGTGRSGRAPRGQNRATILALIGETPGITSREIADATGIGRRVVSTAVSKYKREGLVVPEGEFGGVKLA